MPADVQRCSNCGFENTPASKFCANCGVSLGAAGQAQSKAEGGPVLTAEARKVVTILFVDLVGSTGLTEQLDPEEAREVVGQFYNVVQDAVERFEGSIANLLGDAVLAVFGLPVAHEDDPERAVRTGLTIRDAMPDFNDRLAAAHGVRLAVRVGINTGEVVAASGSTFDRDFLISNAVTTAARLQQTVAPGTVVVGERTYRLTHDAIEYRDLPPLEVKGKTTPLAAWEAVAPLPERQEARPTTAPLIGRRGELGLLRQVYQRTCDEGLLHLVTVLGQAGVGKSRLIREFLAEVLATDPEPQVLRGRSVALGGQIGYRALIDILRNQSGLMDTDSPGAVREKLSAWLLGAVPERGDLLEGLLLTFGGGNGAGADPVRQRQQLFEAWRTLFAALAAARPVIAVFEDLHWADEGVLDLIQSIVDTTEDAPLVLVCAGRPDLLEHHPDWGKGGHNAVAINLKPLRAHETEQLVESLGTRDLAPELRKTIAHRAEGNPLFAEELVRMLLESGSPHGPAEAGPTIPDTVQAVLTARIDRLPPHERRVVQAASAIGRTFWPSAVAPLAGLTSAEATTAIDGLIAKDLVIRRPQSTIEGEPEFAFRNILARDVAYNLLPRSQRQRAHAEAARWLEARLGERVEEAVEILAEHLRLAGDDARAAEYLHRAANKARRLYANADSIRLFEQALDSARRAGAPPREIAAIHLGRGEVHQLLGAYPAALADFEAGLVAARAGGDAALEAVLENRVGLIHHREVRLDEAAAHFQRAETLARKVGDGLTRGLSLVDLATVAWDLGRLSSDDQALNEGINLLKETGDRSSLARALNLLSMTHYAAGKVDAAIAAAKEALAEARQAGDKSREATSLSYLCVINGWTGNYGEALKYGQAAKSLAEEIGDRRRIAYALEFMVVVYRDIGEWGTGIRLIEDHLPLMEEVTKLELPFVYMILGGIYHEIGDPERARAAFHSGAELLIKGPAWQMHVLVSKILIAYLDRNFETLHQQVAEVQNLAWGAFVPSDAEVLFPVGEVLLEASRADELSSLLGAVRSKIEAFGSRPQLAALAILDARLARLRGNIDAAVAYLDRAIQLSEACGNVIMPRRARELRLQWLNREEDRVALRALLERLAASLPDDLRGIFLASPRVSPYLG